MSWVEEDESQLSFVVGDDEVELAADTSEDEFDFNSDEETSSGIDSDEFDDDGDDDAGAGGSGSDDDDGSAIELGSSSDSDAPPRKPRKPRGKAKGKGSRKMPPAARKRKRKPWESDEEDTPAARRARVPHAVVHKRAVTERQAVKHVTAVMDEVRTYKTPAEAGTCTSVCHVSFKPRALCLIVGAGAGCCHTLRCCSRESSSDAQGAEGQIV